MIIRTSQVTEVEKEIKLPFYSKGNAHAFKIVSESKCICICTITGMESIQLQNFINSLVLDSPQITAEEFESIAVNIQSVLNSYTYSK